MREAIPATRVSTPVITLTLGLIFACWISNYGLLALPTRSNFSYVMTRPSESPRTTTIPVQPSDYVESEEAFERLLERLSAETIAADSIAANPSNFVGDDISHDEILKLLEARDHQQAERAPATVEARSTTLRPIAPVTGASRANPDGDDIDDLLENERQEQQASTASIEGVHSEPATGAPTNEAQTIAATTEAPLPMIGSDAEWEEVLEQLRADAAQSIKHPANYANSDDELNAIIERLAEINASPDKHLERWHKGLSVDYAAHECPICQDEMTPEDEFSLKCSHKFHRACLISWVRTGHDTCPMCRQRNLSLRLLS